MRLEQKTVVGCLVAGLMGLSASPALAQTPANGGHGAGAGAGAGAGSHAEIPDGPMVQAVRQATASFKDVQAALNAGYARSSGCVSGADFGAMGIHYGNARLLEDGMLDASRPEVLVYEPVDGQLRLAAAEYVVLADQWNATNAHPPVLNGQHFHYVGAPNRAGLPAHYELHVWAWTRNPNGTFADWNPRVRCDSYQLPQ